MSQVRGQRHARRNQRSEATQRTLTALPAIAVALVLVLYGGLVFAVGLFVVGCVAMHELYSMYPRAHAVRLGGFVALGALLLAALYGGTYQVLLVTVAMLPVLFMLTAAQKHPSVGGMGLTLVGIWWIGLALATAVLLRRLPHGENIVIDVLIGTFLGDTGAYVGGHLFGEHALAPRISPGKTVEGLLIGGLCAVAGVWLAGRFQQAWLTTDHALILGLGVAVAGPLGDLFESFVKRQAHVKDSGKLMGPHGGILDRLDAVFFAIVVGYYIWNVYA